MEMTRIEQFLTIFATLFTEYLPALLVSLVLLFMSATFSGCETSLFSLSTPELNRIRAGRNRLDRVIASLHSSLKSLLPTLLFCNMAVNVMIYSLSAAIATGLGNRHGAGATFVFSMASLFVVVFFGEVFPKQFAISSSRLVANATALPVWLCYRLLAKPMRVMNAIVAVCERILIRDRSDNAELREEELRLLVELSKNDGVISEGEYELIDGIVELPDVRIRDIMIPRVDIPSLAPGASLAGAVAAARKARHCKLPVLDKERNDLAGWIDARDIYADAGGEVADDAGSVETYLRQFQYFSEHDRADQVLERIKGGGGDLFAVVDERGQIIGYFTLQDIMDEVLGHFGEHGAPPPTEIREQNGEYIISGRLNVKEWRELFGVSAAIPRSATVGGLVVSLLGRMARPGDKIRLENMEMTVRAIWRNRVSEVGLRLINIKQEGA